MEVEALAVDIQTDVQHPNGPPLDSSQPTSWSRVTGEAVLHRIPRHETVAVGCHRCRSTCLSGFGSLPFATDCHRFRSAGLHAPSSARRSHAAESAGRESYSGGWSLSLASM